MRDFHLPGRSPVYASHGMAATSMPAATLTALDVLRAGGNALDAAVAATAVLCVIEPQSTGIGGDCFCLYAPAGAGKVFALNGSGRAPAAATIDWFEQRQISAIENTSAHAVTVPGAVNAWETLLKAHGRKGLDELLQPAIGYAAEGWPVHQKVAWDWARLEPKLRKNGAHAFLPGGKAQNAGDIFRQPALAETLRGIARHGAKAFYEGPVAADIVATLQARGGLQTEEDFAAGQRNAEFVEPITLNWHGYDVYQCPPMVETQSPLACRKWPGSRDSCRARKRAVPSAVANPGVSISYCGPLIPLLFYRGLAGLASTLSHVGRMVGELAAGGFTESPTH